MAIAFKVAYTVAANQQMFIRLASHRPDGVRDHQWVFGARNFVVMKLKGLVAVSLVGTVVALSATQPVTRVMRIFVRVRTGL